MSVPSFSPVWRAHLPAAALALALLGPGGLSAQESRAEPPPQEAQVVIQGEVVDHESGEPVRGAAVSLGPGPEGTVGAGTRVTNDEGRFRFRRVPSGIYRLTVTILGYEDLVDTLRVADEDLNLELHLSTEPIRLEPIVVEARRVRPGMRPAVRGMMNEAGGYVISREDIERRHPMYLTDVLGIVPGARVIKAQALQSRLLLRGDCQPIVLVDGVRLSQSEGLDRLVSPNNVESVEIYHGLNLPVEYGMHGCGGVVIWTRRGGPAEGFEPLSSFWTRALMAGGALLLAFLATR